MNPSDLYPLLLSTYLLLANKMPFPPCDHETLTKNHLNISIDHPNPQLALTKYALLIYFGSDQSIFTVEMYNKKPIKSLKLPLKTMPKLNGKREIKSY